MRYVYRGYNAILNGMAVLAGILIFLSFVMIVVDVTMRIVVFIDAVTQFLPPAAKKVIARVVYAICTVAASIYCVHAAGLVIDAWQRDMVDVRSVDMPLWTLYFPMPICLFFVAMEFARYLIGIDDMYSQSIEERGGV